LLRRNRFGPGATLARRPLAGLCCSPIARSPPSPDSHDAATTPAHAGGGGDARRRGGGSGSGSGSGPLPPGTLMSIRRQAPHILVRQETSGQPIVVELTEIR
jgi:hypothetical protein